MLLTGGRNASDRTLVSAEVYDPATGSWTVTGKMNKARSSCAAVLLDTEEVLVAAGGDKPTKLAELFDPVTGNWTLTGTANFAFVEPTITLLPSGNALVAGGFGNPVYQGSSLYDPATGNWAPSSKVQGTHGSGATATLLANGEVLLLGGMDGNFMPTADADLYQSR